MLLAAADLPVEIPFVEKIKENGPDHNNGRQYITVECPKIHHASLFKVRLAT
jgi:hypothetical protein